MTCAMCRETTERGKATVTLERGPTTVVFRGVPADICPQCGEEWIDSDVSDVLLKTLDELAKAGVQVEVREYKAAA